VPEIIRIEEADKLAVSRTNAKIARVRRSRVRLRQVAYSLAVGSRDTLRPIGRTVIDNDDLDGPVRLSEDTIERRG